LNADELRRLITQAGELRGWDWSSLRMERDPVPWAYQDIVRRYVTPSSRVLDVGTGGGEVFLSLAPYFGQGVGIDRKVRMIRTAIENRAPALRDKVSFVVMKGQALGFPDDTFDVVMNRHASIFFEEVVRVLRPGGYFITQQVGGRNAQSIFDAFGWGSNEQHWQRFFAARGMDFTIQQIKTLVDLLPGVGCTIVANGEYDVPIYFPDIQALVFYLLWTPLPEKLDPDRHHEQVTRLVQERQAPRGIESSEHREFLVARKVGDRTV
jgi:SAM-dependent methyltransferase